MSHQNQPFQESITLDHYIHITKRQTLALKKVRKEEEQKKLRTRKCSTQMSIVTWLHQGNTQTQNCPILELDKSLLMKVFGYLRLSELVVASQVCSYFSSCYRSLWGDKQFFGQFETDKFTSEELGEVIKLTRLDHIRQLRQIYSGKNIRHCRQKIKIKAGSGGPATGGMLEVFSVLPKNPHAGSTHLMDSHLTQVINTSFRSLKVIQLVKCGFLQNFHCLGRCIDLTKLTISYNDNLRNEDIKTICKRCTNLQEINLQACRGLDENIFEHIQYVEMLECLGLKSFRQSFGKLKKLANNLFLKRLILDGSLINDLQGSQLSELKGLTHLSIKSCLLLTDVFIDWLIRWTPNSKLQKVQIEGCLFEESKMQKLRSILPPEA